MKEQLQETRTCISELGTKLQSIRWDIEILEANLWDIERLEANLIVKNDTKAEALKYSSVEENIVAAMPLLQHVTNCLSELAEAVREVISV